MISVWESLRLGLMAVSRAGLRSFLTVLGVLIGIAAVVIVVALGESARRRVSEQVQNLGSNSIYLFNAPGGGQRGTRRGYRLSLADAEAIRADTADFGAVTVYASTKANVQGAFDTASVDVAGSDQHYSSVRGHPLVSGRDLNESDVRTKARVGLIGPVAARRLFGAADPLGKSVRIGRHRFEIVGLLSPKGQGPFGGDPDDTVILPIRTWLARLAPGRGQRVDVIVASASTSADLDDFRERVDRVMMERHRIPNDGKRDYRLETPDAFREAEEAISSVLSAVLVSVAAISLFVGGLGVTNILLVSVNERKSEIGTRLAIGARPGAIRAQFLAESVTLTLLGGVMGLLLASAGLRLLEQQFGWEMHLSLDAVAAALVTSLGIGLVFGTLPAHRAAQLDPIEALRHD